MNAIENIIDQLKTCAAEYDGWADGHGHLTEERQGDGYRVECWWDDTDPSNAGYAYRAARYEGGEHQVGEEEGGEL